MAAKQNKKSTAKKGKTSQEKREVRRPSFKSLLIQYIILTIAFYFTAKSCENARKSKEEAAKAAQTEQALKEKNKIKPARPEDSLQWKSLQNQMGDFAYALQLPPSEPVQVKTELFDISISSRGGAFEKLLLNRHTNAKGKPVRLIDNNQDFNIDLKLKNGKIISTRDFPFVPEVKRADSVTIVTMKLFAGQDKYLAFEYRIPQNDYMIDFKVYTKNLGHILSDDAYDLHWDLKAYSHEFDPKYENNFTTLKYEYEDGKIDELSALSKEDSDEAEDVDWVDFKQHFFSSFIITGQKPFEKARFKQISLRDKEQDSIHTKHFFLDTRLQPENGNLYYEMKWYHGPNDYELLASYDMDLEEVIPLGWGIFGWINKYAFMPLFDFLKKFISNYGLIIILMTLIVRLVTSPLYYKTYVSQAKMKIIRPEMEEINRKYKDNPMKRQKEIMALQSKTGVSPLSGCVPSLLFIPIFYALFRFFPAELDLRHKGFLWVNDLSSYESFVTLPFNIPFIGNHISIFALIASVLMFVYMKMNQSSQNMSMPTQEGMPDLSKMMKWMLYLMPFMMFFFFNNYASGLSLYYMISTFLSLVIVYVIKNYVIDEEKVKAQIEENKKKPKKQSRFQAKLQALMEQAEQQRRLQEEMKRKRNRKK